MHDSAAVECGRGSAGCEMVAFVLPLAQRARIFALMWSPIQ